VAFIVDVVIINLIAALTGAIINLIASLLGDSSSLSTGEAVAGAAAWWVWFVAYFVTFWTLTGQTPGARLLGIRVQSDNGAGLHGGQALRRFGGLILAALPLGAGLLMILFDDRRRGLQDRIGGTVVCWVPEEVADMPAPALEVSPAARPVLEPGPHPPGSPARPVP
jgi:uncharacterized RDD family membrane protein YckC